MSVLENNPTRRDNTGIDVVVSFETTQYFFLDFICDGSKLEVLTERFFVLHFFPRFILCICYVELKILPLVFSIFLLLRGNTKITRYLAHYSRSGGVLYSIT